MYRKCIVILTLCILTFDTKVFVKGDVCVKHNPPWGYTYIECNKGCCGTLYDTYCCVDSLTLTVVLSLLGAGICIAILAFLIWYIVKTKKDQSRVEPQTVPVMTQTDTAAA